MKTCHLEKDSSYMFLMQKIGVLYHRKGNYVAAIDFTKESINSAKTSPNAYRITSLLVDNYYNLFYYYNETKQFENKYAAIHSCIAYAIKGNVGFDKVIAPLNDQTEYLYNKGEYSLCNKIAKLGEEIIRKYYNGKDSISYIVAFVIKQVDALYISNNISAAEELLEEKILQFRKKGYYNHLAAFYNSLGTVNIKKNHTKALSYFLLAYKVNSITKFWKGCAQNLALAATIYAKNFNQYDKGLKYCGKAIKYHVDATDSLYILKQTGNIYVLKREYDKAQYFFQQAYNTVQYGMNETFLLKNSFQFPGFDVLQNLSDLTRDKGDAYLQQYYHTKNDSFLTKALGVYKKGDLFLAKIKNEQQLQLGSNLVWRNTARNLYEHSIEACYANNNIGDAFYFFEKSRAVLLNDQINEQRWMADAGNSKKEIYAKAKLV